MLTYFKHYCAHVDALYVIYVFNAFSISGVAMPVAWFDRIYGGKKQTQRKMMRENR